MVWVRGNFFEFPHLTAQSQKNFQNFPHMRTRPHLSARADVGCGAEFLEFLLCGWGAVRKG